jgi:Outer membrane lipoprotein-sorting protein
MIWKWMRGLKAGLLVLVSLPLLCGLPAKAGTADVLNAVRAAHEALRDLSTTVRSREVQERELRRMGSSADMALEVPRLHLFFAAPDCVRMEGKRGIFPVTLIVKGNVKLIRYGPLRKRQDVTGQPDRKQGGLDFGLLTHQVWTDFRITSEGRQPWEDHTALVLRLVARSSPQGSYHLVWIDAQTFRVLQIEDRTGEGNLKRRQVFRKPIKTSAGVWLAQRIEIFNSDKKFVGALELTDILVNHGVDEKLFSQ